MDGSLCGGVYVVLIFFQGLIEAKLVWYENVRF